MPRLSSRNLAAESADASGLTSRLVLAYVERELGRDGVEALLDRCGLAGWEPELRDERFWFSFETKIELFEAVVALMGASDAVRRLGAASFELNFSPALKLGLRALGTPSVIYSSTARVSAKFSSDFAWDVVESGHGRAVLRFHSPKQRPYHPLDCQYNQGLLAAVPELFGLPPAEIRHTHCGADGADGCTYDVRWDTHRSLRREWGAWSAGTAAAAGLTATAPVLGPLVALPSMWLGALTFWRRRKATQLALRAMEAELAEHRELAARLSSSTRDLVADLCLDEVLDRVMANAKATVTGKRFVLLLFDGPGLPRCHPSTDAGAETVAALQRWVAFRRERLAAPLLDDRPDVELEPEDAQEPAMRVAGLYSTPLRVRGRCSGVLIALGYGFLPRDTELLDAYAAQTAIAVANARQSEPIQALAS